MTIRPTLLAHIAPRVSSGEENLATEALCFVLDESPAARDRFVNFMGRILNRPLPQLTFRTQAGDPDGTIPDLVGLDSSGRPVIYVESKFWAGLTQSQPVGYLRRLQRESGSGLVVLAPANRLVSLWPALVRCCRDDGMEVETTVAAEHFRLEAISLPSLGLTSWAAVLAELVHATSTAGDIAASEDLRQLKGLCDSMEQAGFLPLRAEELTGNLGRRVQDYCGLVDDLTSMLVAEGLGGLRGLKATGGRGSYKRYIWLKGNGACIAWSSRRWAKIYPTPLWLGLKGPDYKPSPHIRQALAAQLASQPPAAFADADYGVLVPLLLPPARERHVVLASLAEQVRAVCAHIPAGAGGIAPPSPGIPQAAVLAE